MARGLEVGFEPTRLIDPDGNVFAEEGEQLRGAGGLDNEDRFALSMVERAFADPGPPSSAERF